MSNYDVACIDTIRFRLNEFLTAKCNISCYKDDNYEQIFLRLENFDLGISYKTILKAWNLNKDFKDILRVVSKRLKERGY